MYKLNKNTNGEVISVIIKTETSCTDIPFDPANTDYANFKKEVLAGAELQDADGNVMTQAKADAFIATLP